MKTTKNCRLLCSNIYLSKGQNTDLKKHPKASCMLSCTRKNGKQTCHRRQRRTSFPKSRWFPHLDPLQYGNIAAGNIGRIYHQFSNIPGDFHERDRPCMCLLSSVRSIEARHMHLHNVSASLKRQEKVYKDKSLCDERRRNVSVPSAFH